MSETFCLHLRCDKCNFLDVVLRENAEKWTCPNCEMQQNKMEDKVMHEFIVNVQDGEFYINADGYRVNEDGSLTLVLYDRVQASVMHDPEKVQIVNRKEIASFKEWRSILLKSQWVNCGPKTT